MRAGVSSSFLLCASLAVSLAACADDAGTEAAAGGPSSTAGPTGTGGDDGAATTGASGPGATTTGSGGGSASSTAATSGPGGGAGGAGGGAGGGGGGDAGATLRFVALGDGGEGNDTQYAVAAMVDNVCQARGGCDFALYLGDNIYNSGVDGTDDEQFLTKFEQPYAGLDFRFYVVLGNHDYGGQGAGYEQWKAQAQVDYSNTSSKWTMPQRFYGFQVPADAGPPAAPRVDLFGLDTNWIMYTSDDEQQDWLDGALAQSTARWKIAFGHHPYVSNGQHGNAGEYEGIPYIPIVSGANVRDFMEDSVCGKVDLYLCGHDHNRQWLEPTCGTEFAVSGTAAKTTGLKDRGTPTFFEDDQDGGFLLVEITENTLVGTFFDQQGNEEFSRTVVKP